MEKITSMPFFLIKVKNLFFSFTVLLIRLVDYIIQPGFARKKGDI